MTNLKDLLGEKIIRKVKENPVKGGISISRENGEEQYKRQIKALNKYLKENDYNIVFSSINDMTYVSYELKGLVQNA